jgi:hypothetical protein
VTVPDNDYSAVQAQVLAAMKEQESAERMTIVDDHGKKVELECANGLWTPVEEAAAR